MKLIDIQIIHAGRIKVVTGNQLGIDIFPINVKFINKVSGEITWESDLSPHMWTLSPLFCDCCIVKITDKNGNTLIEKEIDNILDGDPVSNYFELWSKANKGALGIIGGSHNGTSGEWVNAINKNILDAIIYEPLDLAFQDLKKYYKNKENVSLKNKAISVNGGPLTFYASKTGSYCSTASLEFANNNIDFNEFNKEVIDSESIKNIVEYYKPKWFHLDLEGLDFEIIMEILKCDNNMLPDLILYESQHINPVNLNILNEELNKKNYFNITGDAGNSIMIKQ
jgi:FkbM family methyltransferase